MKQPGETCKIRYCWTGDVDKCPRLGDVLKTTTGRRYIILKITGQLVTSMGLEVLVMAKDDDVPGGARVYPLKWDKRDKK